MFKTINGVLPERGKLITVIGSSNTDMVVRTAHIPGPGETVLGDSFFMAPGGKGANQAVTIARLGGNVCFVTRLGKDVFGEQSRIAFEKEGVQGEFVSFDELHPSGVALICVDDKGENCIVVAPGANAHLGTEDITRASGPIGQSEILLMQLEIPLTTVAAVVSMARKMDKKVILNPAPACVLPEGLLQDLYLITPNESEAEFLTGVKIDGIESCLEAARILKGRGVQHVIITLGARGTFICAGSFTGIVGTEKVNVVDTTGAGDIFNGALALALSRDSTIEDAVRFANHVAGISVTRAGAQPSIPYPDELVLTPS